MKALIAILVVLLLLAAGLVVVDRVAENYAAGKISETLTSDLRLSQPAQVQIQGFPFLTQWASGTYGEIDVKLATVTAETVSVDSVDATVRGLHVPSFVTSGSQVRGATADAVDLSGLVPFAELPLPSGFTASASGSQLQVSGSISVFGVSVPVTATEAIVLHGTTATFTPTNVRAVGAGIDLSAAAARRLTVTVNLQSLPFGVQVTGIAVTENGLQVTAQGQHVSLAGA